MDESQLAVACKEIYAETNGIYNLYRRQLGANDLGFKILYGPPRVNSPVLFIGDQPGGKVADEKPTERYGWPLQCEYATETWTLAETMRAMFGSEFLLNCVGINANFFRAPCAESWGKVPYQLRSTLQKFCLGKVDRIISLIQPKNIIVIGLSVLEKFGPTEPIVIGTKKRILMRRGAIGRWSAVSTIHLSGSRISKEDRSAIANATLRLVNQGEVPGAAKNGVVQSSELTRKSDAPRSRAERSVPLGTAFEATDPQQTLEVLCKLIRMGLPDKAFRHLHHLKDGIKGFQSYCVKILNKGGAFESDGNNARVHERLRYVMDKYLASGKPDGDNGLFLELAIESFGKIPPLPTGR